MRRLADEVREVLTKGLKGASGDNGDLEPKPLPSVASSQRHKAKEFWTSTPCWGAIGAVLGVASAHVSLYFLFLALWIVLEFEFMRVGFLVKGVRRNVANVTFGVLLAIMFVLLGKYLPKQATPPSLDQQLTAFAKKFPLLNAPPKPEKTEAPKPEPVQPVKTSQPLPLHEAGLKMTMLDAPSPFIAVNNTSNQLVENVNWSLVLFRSSDQGYFSFYPLPGQTIPYVKPHSWSPPDPLNLEFVNKKVSASDPNLHEGDVLTGTLALDCPQCAGSTYIVQFIWKRSGWFYRVQESKGGLEYPQDMSRNGIAAYIEKLEGQSKLKNRITIADPIVLKTAY